MRKLTLNHIPYSCIIIVIIINEKIIVAFSPRTVGRLCVLFMFSFILCLRGV